MMHNKQTEENIAIANIELIEANGALHHEAMGALIAPYKAEKEKSMNVVIGEAAETIEVGKPESKLTNLIADINQPIHRATTRRGYGYNRNLSIVALANAPQYTCKVTFLRICQKICVVINKDLVVFGYCKGAKACSE